MDEWVKKMWYTYAMEHYSALKRMRDCMCLNMDGPECTVLSKIRQIQKVKYLLDLPLWGI
jgi:hypothetical protein